jgi:hypothetical protein
MHDVVIALTFFFSSTVILGLARKSVREPELPAPFFVSEVFDYDSAIGVLERNQNPGPSITETKPLKSDWPLGSILAPGFLLLAPSSHTSSTMIAPLV